MKVISSIPGKKRILVAVLDWGLGHAARCVPLVESLLQEGHEVILGANGRAAHLLQMEFPNLLLENLPSYRIRYFSNNMFFNIGIQSPKIMWAAWCEYRKLAQLIKKHQLDIVISDNRFGCFNTAIKSIFLSHQLWIKIPFRPLEIVVNRINHWVIKQFDECWIPDWSDKNRLAGELSRPIMGISHRYLGILSRMKKESPLQKRPLVAILSGPEPKRTELERLLIQQAQQLDKEIVIVQGKPEAKEKPTKRLSSSVQLIPALSGVELNQLVNEASVLICRSGYSSLMDLVQMQKQAILIPTPGQTEQEYLAQKYSSEGLFFSQPQSIFQLEQALNAIGQYPGFGAKHSTLEQEALIQEAVASL